jgi:hypothetical protein
MDKQKGREHVLSPLCLIILCHPELLVFAGACGDRRRNADRARSFRSLVWLMCWGRLMGRMGLMRGIGLMGRAWRGWLVGGMRLMGGTRRRRLMRSMWLVCRHGMRRSGVWCAMQRDVCLCDTGDSRGWDRGSSYQAVYDKGPAYYDDRQYK